MDWDYWERYCRRMGMVFSGLSMICRAFKTEDEQGKNQV